MSAWHATAIMEMGLKLVWVTEIDTGSLRHGDNSELRLNEQVWVFAKPDGLF